MTRDVDYLNLHQAYKNLWKTNKASLSVYDNVDHGKSHLAFSVLIVQWEHRICKTYVIFHLEIKFKRKKTVVFIR